ARYQAFPAIAEAADLHVPDGVVRIGAARNLVVGRGLERTSLCRRPDGQAARAAGVVLSLRTLDARPVGVCRVSGLLHAAGGDVVDCYLRSGPLAQATERRRAWHLRQKPYRSGSGVCALRGGACISLPGFLAGG